jgi:hypothetical protein
MDQYTMKYAQQGGFFGFFNKKKSTEPSFFRRSIDKSKKFAKQGMRLGSQFAQNELTRSALNSKEEKREFDKMLYAQNVAKVNRFLQDKTGGGQSTSQKYDKYYSKQTGSGIPIVTRLDSTKFNKMLQQSSIVYSFGDLQALILVRI